MMEVEEAVHYHDADMVPEDVAIDYADEIMMQDDPHAFAIPEVDMEHDASNDDEEIEYDMEDLSAASETAPPESVIPPPDVAETISTTNANVLHHPQTPSPLGKTAPESAFHDTPHDAVTEVPAPALPETSFQPATEVEPAPAPVPLPPASDALVSAEAQSTTTHPSLDPAREETLQSAVHTHSASPVAEANDGSAHPEAEGGPSHASKPEHDQEETADHAQEASEPAVVDAAAAEHTHPASATTSAPNDAQEEYNEEVNAEVYPSSVLISNPHTSSLPSFYLFVAPDGANGDELVYLADEAHLFFEPISSVFEALRAHEDHLGVPGNVELSLYSEGLDLNVSEDNVYSREVSLNDLNTLHIGCELEGPLSLRLEHITPRFIQRYRAILTELQRVSSEDNTPASHTDIQQPAEPSHEEVDPHQAEEEPRGAEQSFDDLVPSGDTTAINVIPPEHDAEKEEFDDPPDAKEFKESQESQAAVEHDPESEAAALDDAEELEPEPEAEGDADENDRAPTVTESIPGSPVRSPERENVRPPQSTSTHEQQVFSSEPDLFDDEFPPPHATIERPSPTHPFRVTFAHSSDHEGDDIDVPETSSVAGDETQTTRFFDSQLQGGSLVFNTQDGLDIPYRADEYANEDDETDEYAVEFESGMHGAHTAQARSSHPPTKSQGGTDLRPESSPKLRWLTPLDSDDENDNNNEDNNDGEAESHANNEADVASNAQQENEEPELEPEPEPWEEEPEPEAEADELISYDEEEEEADELGDGDPNEDASTSAPSLAVQSTQTQAAIYDPDDEAEAEDDAAAEPYPADADGEGDLDYDEVEDGEVDDAADAVEEPQLSEESVALSSAAVLTPRPDGHASRPSESSKTSPIRTWSSHSSKRSFVEDDDEVENVKAHVDTKRAKIH